ncbi:MAG TPA: histidinol-phosphate transaminase [bacterium]|nr:histidinol-phosphate transaminase [bacterium]HPP30424.1 histidinol-phosphate transaminase [bacterium]
MNKKIEELIRQDIKKIAPYVPGKPIEELQRAYGLDIERIVKLASNENPLGPSPKAVEAVKRCADKISRYPEGSGYYLKNKIAEVFNQPPETIILGSGSSEIISMGMELFINPGEEVIYPAPSFLIYPILAYKIGAVPVEIPLQDGFSYDLNMFLEKITPKTKVIILCNPNNPTGTIIYKKQIEEFMKNIPDDIIIISDEAYREYVDTEDFGTAYPYLYRKNIIITRTLSKIYGLAGLRIGFGMARKEIIEFMERIRPPFNTTIPAQEAGIAALDDQEYVKKSFENNIKGRTYLYSAFNSLGIEYIPTYANFILCRIPDASLVVKKLEKRGIIVRGMFGVGPEYVRITIGTDRENTLLIENLKQLLGGRK